MPYWLLKSEPEVYGIADLERDKTSVWDGVRNYQARNYLRAMQKGDLAFFYHSSTEALGIAGLGRVKRTEVVDPSQFDPASPYFDAKSTRENPRWWTVEIEFARAFPQTISLDTLREKFSPDELILLRRGNRLSVMPVEDAVAERILKMAEGK
ncbi:MAG: EVE domain-containing protein [Meiothermus sp.]